MQSAMPAAHLVVFTVAVHRNTRSSGPGRDPKKKSHTCPSRGPLVAALLHSCRILLCPGLVTVQGKSARVHRSL